MISDNLGQQFHDRATRGETLSAEERAQLEEWYTRQDRVETKDLAVGKIQQRASDLQTQIDAALAQLTTLTKRIQEIAAENDLLRQEIAALRRQVPQLA